MAGKSDATENSFLLLLYNATSWTGVAVNHTTTPFTQVFVALHTADPTDAGTQTSSEISYTNYARVQVVRTSGGWTVTGNSASPVAAITFPESAGGTGGTVTHFSTSGAAGGSVLWHVGTVTPNITVVSGVAPVLKTTSTITED